MPKKFQGENTKATAARAAKAARAAAEKANLEKAKEDAYWEDNDKKIARKQNRKDEKEVKAQEAAARKAELKKLAEQEMENAAVGKIAKPSSSKVTRAQLDAHKEKLKQDADDKAKAKDLAAKKIVVVNEDEPIEENINRLQVDGHEARTVDEAISVLKSENVQKAADDVDRHPEKRLKAAYEAYEEKRLPSLKEENPSLRLSQLKQIIKKDWMKAPENPLNIRLKNITEVSNKINDTVE